MNIVLEIKESIRKLLDSSNEYSRFSSQFHQHPTDYITKHFNDLINRSGVTRNNE
jgi:hypothetical protein